ncbi:MAG: glutamate--tRNA ligase [Vicinamibacterales bacterium]
MTPRLRFAPSPTGYLHVGGARTALFNWLYARRHGGAFILRIEDTDVERSQAEMVTGILDGLRWLGIDWDEGPEVGGPHAPYFQSGRLDRYRAAAKQLLDSGHAFEDAGAVRFKVPPGKTRFTDSVHGPIEFDNEHIESFVILRSDTHPTYHLSVVVDDIDMAITHVVRGDDHISNTPKQILLYNAFGKTPPAFAHVPLIMGSDKQRLSKRHGATSVTEYEKQGYLPEAMFNFLALLGWGTGSNDELFTKEELIQRFNLEGISGGNAVFNTEKLDWFNHQHLLKLSDEELTARLSLPPDPRLPAILTLLRPRCKKLTDFPEQLKPFWEDPETYDPDGVKKFLSTPGTGDHLRALRTVYEEADWSEAAIEKDLRQLADARAVKAAVLIHGTRLALTGRMMSPGLFEMVVLIGRDAVVRRVDKIASVLP